MKTSKFWGGNHGAQRLAPISTPEILLNFSCTFLYYISIIVKALCVGMRIAKFFPRHKKIELQIYLFEFDHSLWSLSVLLHLFDERIDETQTFANAIFCLSLNLAPQPPPYHKCTYKSYILINFSIFTQFLIKKGLQKKLDYQPLKILTWKKFMPSWNFPQWFVCVEWTKKPHKMSDSGSCFSVDKCELCQEGFTEESPEIKCIWKRFKQPHKSEQWKRIDQPAYSTENYENE